MQPQIILAGDLVELVGHVLRGDGVEIVLLRQAGGGFLRHGGGVVRREEVHPLGVCLELRAPRHALQRDDRAVAHRLRRGGDRGGGGVRVGDGETLQTEKVRSQRRAAEHRDEQRRRDESARAEPEAPYLRLFLQRGKCFLHPCLKRCGNLFKHIVPGIPHTGTSSPKTSRSFPRPANSRDLTVPSGICKIRDISRMLNPST